MSLSLSEARIMIHECVNRGNDVARLFAVVVSSLEDID
jgi:hypothetical protein